MGIDKFVLVMNRGEIFATFFLDTFLEIPQTGFPRLFGPCTGNPHLGSLAAYPFHGTVRRFAVFNQVVIKRPFQNELLFKPAPKGRLLCCLSWTYLRGYALRNAPRIRPFSHGFHNKFHFETVSM
jgi:hypothetical protein